jgi:6-phosphogluconolactonase
VHRVEGELGAAEAARRYDEALENVTLDLALNGIGPDGHTASLFPHAPALDERERRAVAAEPGLEPFVARVTLTPPVFDAAALLVYLVTGAAKAEAVQRAFAEEPSPATPASLVRGRRTIALLDRTAAIRLPQGS